MTKIKGTLTKTLPKGTVKFRIYPDSDDRHFFRVFVFRTDRSMTRWVKKYSPDMKSGFNAACFPYTVMDETGRKKFDIGCLTFSRENLGAGIQSHEATHAALTYVRAITGTEEGWAFAIPDCNARHGAEETLAYAVSGVVRQLNKKFRKRGLYE